MEVVKVNDKWFEKRYHWCGVKSDAEMLGYSLRPLTDFEAKRYEERHG